MLVDRKYVDLHLLINDQTEINAKKRIVGLGLNFISTLCFTFDAENI